MNLETLWESYRTNIQRFLQARLANPEDVEDLLQEILLKTHTKLDTLSSEHSVQAWLFQIARHTLIDFYRKKKPVTEAIDEQLQSLEQYEEQYEGQQEDIQNELATCIEPFIQQLPPASAALLMAIDIYGQSQKDYAAKHGVTYSTLKSRVQKSRQQLRKLFEDCCHLSFDQHGKVIEYIPKSGQCKHC